MHPNKTLQLYFFPSVVVRCHLSSLEVHSASAILVLNLIFSIILCSVAASVGYDKICSAVAMGVLDLQIFQEKPNVNMSESDLMPGYLKKSHVPPMLDLLSRIRNDAHGEYFCR